ncbi:MAG: cupin domain-containing protein [Sphingobium sp.]
MMSNMALEDMAATRSREDNDRLRTAPTLDALYAQVDPLDLTPGWISRKSPIMGSTPKSVFEPAHWRYADAQAGLDAAGRLVDVAFAERRNLILRNPKDGNDWATSRTLVCAYQMILPGEFAPSHRHSANALRVIIDGKGTYSIVDGEKMPMESGDVVLTPGGHFHGHGHDGDHPAYWLDCLDVPLNYLLEPMYFQPDTQPTPPVTDWVEQSPFRFSKAMIVAGLDAAEVSSDGRTGQRFVLPTPSMPAVGLEVERLEGGRNYAWSRAGANRIYSVMEGRGELRVENRRYSFVKGDTIVVPSGNWAQIVPAVDSMALELSDAPLMRFANSYFMEWR